MDRLRRSASIRTIGPRGGQKGSENPRSGPGRRVIWRGEPMGEIPMLISALLLLAAQNVSFEEKVLSTVGDDVTADRIVFSPDGRSVAYRGLKGGKYAVWVNKAKGPDYQAVDMLQFTADNRAAYKAANGEMWNVIVGGSPLGAATRQIGTPVFSPDGKK